MQTFLPYPDYARSAAVLDNPRLRNQFFREGLILIRGHWSSHPASRMWQGHFWHLGLYLLSCYHELKSRGFHYPTHARETYGIMLCHNANIDPPPWLGDERLHSSHRANLLRKDPKHYGQFGWVEEPSNEYFWPV